jgi:ATP-dependent Clp protease ATP-binding subunit ClpB
MTSNLGGELWMGGREVDVMRDSITHVLQAHFKPEFLNRIDDTIIFQSLSEMHISKIVDIQLKQLDHRLAAQQITLETDAAARQIIAKDGFDPQFGARPLKRAIQDLLLDPLATQLLQGDFGPGDKITALGKHGEIKFSKLPQDNQA